MRQERTFTVTDPPHLSSGETVPRAMMDTFLALLPVTLVSIYFYRLNAVFLIGVCLGACVLVDVIARRIKGRGPSVGDRSVLVSGLILALCFSPLTPWWTAIFASILAVGIAKEWMGGLGWNRLNPAAFGRAGVIILAPVTVYLNRVFAGLGVRFPMSQEVVDSVTGATPLAMMAHAELPIPHLRLLLAYPGGGGLAETSVLALLLGGAYLLYRRHITWHIPISILATVAVFTAVIGHNPLDHLLAGGLMLGALFMATDWVTSPITNAGRLIFGVMIGILVVVFRVFLGPTGGVAYAILIMNAFVPLIDRLTRRGVFGHVNAMKAAAAKAPTTKTA